MILLALALLPWIAAAVVACLPGDSRRGVAWFAGLAALGITAFALHLAPPVFAGEVLKWSVPWLPALGVDFGFRMDGLAWLFTLLIGGIGALVVLYAAWYLDPKDPARRFYVFLLLFMGAMLGVVLADNLVLLVVFWELTSLSSFLLIGYWHLRDDARDRIVATTGRLRHDQRDGFSGIGFGMRVTTNQNNGSDGNVYATKARKQRHRY